MDSGVVQGGRVGASAVAVNVRQSLGGRRRGIMTTSDEKDAKAGQRGGMGGVKDK